MRMKLIKLGFALTVGLSSSIALSGVGRAETLTMGLGGAVTGLDPHFYSTTPNNLIMAHLFDRLVHRTHDGKLIPGLALSWKALSPTSWEFKLREGVTWHNGEKFTADDVKFSFARALNVPNNLGGFASALRPIANVEVVDPTTIRLTTTGPAPNLPNGLALVAIISEKVGKDATTADYNSGKVTIGTGPYKLVSYTPGDRIELARNESWWDKKPHWDKVTIRLIPNVAVRTAALLSGDIDLIDSPSASDLPRLQQSPEISVYSVPGMRVNYIMPMYNPAEDAPAITDKAGTPIKPTPLQNKKVREALSISINRAALSDRVMIGTSTPTGQWIPSGAQDYVPSIDVPKYDPARAKQLLTEAGYPEGFKLTLSTANDRTPYNVEVAQAIGQMWSRIGVATTIEAIPFNVYSGRGSKSQFGIYLGGWGNNSMEGTSMLKDVLMTRSADTGTGLYNWGLYSNPKIDALGEKAMSEVDTEARAKMMEEATKIVTDDVAFIPVYHFKNIWATKKSIRYEPRVDELTLSINVHPQ
jgi:peptide/nickel transport system substrate-binding protein